MKKIKFKKEFDALICLFNVFNHNLSKKDMAKTLFNFFNSLKKKGIAIIDIPNISYNLKNFKEKEVYYYNKKDIKVTQVFIHNFNKKDFIWTVKEIDFIHSKRGFKSINQRLFFKIITYKEMLKMLKKAGFKNISCFGNFKDSNKKMEKLIFVAQKPF